MRFIIFTSLAILLFGCAQPKYINVVSDSGQQNMGEEASDACLQQFTKSNLCLVWKWENKPTSQSYGSFIFKTYRLNLLDQTPLEVDLIAQPEVILWMPSMGHGSTPTITTRVDVGSYRVTNVFFTMPGEWELRLQVKNGTEVLDEANISINF